MLVVKNTTVKHTDVDIVIMKLRDPYILWSSVYGPSISHLIRVWSTDRGFLLKSIKMMTVFSFINFRIFQLILQVEAVPHTLNLMQ